MQESVLLLHPVHSGSRPRPTHRLSPAPAAAPNILADRLEAGGIPSVVVDEFWMTTLGVDLSDPSAWVDECARLIDRNGITMVGVTMLTYFRSLAHEVIGALADHFPHLKFVVGGPHAAVHPDRIMHFTPQIDAVFTGEADNDIVDIVRFMSGSVANRPVGLTLRGRAPINVTYQVVEPTAFSTPSYDHYAGSVSPDRLIMMTSRGCPTPFCTFCGITAGGGEFRIQEADPQRAALARAAEMGVTAVEFHDSIFTLKRERIDTLFAGVDLGGITEFYCHTRPNDITPEVVDALARTDRRWRVFVGLESADVKVRRSARKSALGMDAFLSNMRYASDHGVEIGVFLIFGLPGETTESIRHTYELLEECQPAEVFASPLKYIPGSTLHRRAVAEGVMGVDDLVDPDGPPGIYVPQGEQLFDALAAVEVFTERFDRSRAHNRVEQSYATRLEPQAGFRARVERLRSQILKDGQP